MSVPHIRSRHHASRGRGSWLVPLSGHWLIGLYIGIDLIFYGVSLISLARAAKS